MPCYAVMGKTGRSHACRLCGKPEAEGGETNFHVLWQCPGRHDKGIVRATREQMVREVVKAVGELDMEEGQERGQVAGAVLVRGAVLGAP